MPELWFVTALLDVLLFPVACRRDAPGLLLVGADRFPNLVMIDVLQMRISWSLHSQLFRACMYSFSLIRRQESSGLLSLAHTELVETKAAVQSSKATMMKLSRLVTTTITSKPEQGR